MNKKIQINQNLLSQLFDESIRCHPYEACGFVLGEVSGSERIAKEFVACKNIQDELHAKDPERYTRKAETAYVIDSKEQDAVFAQAKQKGLSVIGVFHSHPEHDVYFSAEDKNNAAPWGEPLFPELSYVVVSVYDKKIKGASDFCWQNEQGDFIEEKLI